VSILKSLCSPTGSYDNRIVLALWKAVTDSQLRDANAFESFITHLRNCRASESQDGQLLLCDRWLVSQVGVALLIASEKSQDWKTGYVVLHHLHRFGVHYIKHSQPSANLPPAKRFMSQEAGFKIQSAWKCLQAITKGTAMGQFAPLIRDLYNELLATVLSHEDAAVSPETIHKAMKAKKIYCQPNLFAKLQQQLALGALTNKVIASGQITVYMYS